MLLVTAVDRQPAGHAAARCEHPAVAPTTRPEPRRRADHRRVVVVHHDVAWATRLAGLLRRPPGPARVQVFTDPRAALRELLHDPPAVVLTALEMPFIDGADLIRRLHAHCVDAATILLADLSMVQAKALPTGAVSIPASIDPVELTHVVKDTMSRLGSWQRGSTGPVTRYRGPRARPTLPRG